YFNTGAEAINGLTGTGTVQKHPAVAGPTVFTVGAGNATASFGGVIANGGGTVGLVKAGTGTQTLTGANTYTDPTTIAGGVLSISADNNLGTAPGAAVANSITIANGSTLQTSGELASSANRPTT